MPIFGNPDIQKGADNYAGAATNLFTDPDTQTGFITGDVLFNVDATQAPQGVLPPIQRIDGIRAVAASGAGGQGRGVVGLSRDNIGVAGYVSEPGPIPPLPPGVTNTGVLGYSVGGSVDPGVITPAGVTGQSDIGPGVYGYSGNTGVVGVGGGNAGVVGMGGDAGVFGLGGPGNTGVVGQAGSGTADGVRGFGTGSFSGVAGFGDKDAGTGVYGQGACGVRGIGNGGPTTQLPPAPSVCTGRLAPTATVLRAMPA